MNRMSRRTKRLLIGGALAITLLIGAWALLAESGDEEAAAGVPAGTTAGMEGMDMGGMDMSSDGTVRLSANQIRQFGVTFDFAEQRTLEDVVRTVGIVNFDETRMARVAPKFGGFIERLYVDFTGKPVRRGQPLVEIYSPELVSAQEEMLLAAGLDGSLNRSAVPGVDPGSSNLLDAAKRRLRLWDVSEVVGALRRSGYLAETHAAPRQGPGRPAIRYLLTPVTRLAFRTLDATSPVS